MVRKKDASQSHTHATHFGCLCHIDAERKKAWLLCGPRISRRWLRSFDRGFSTRSTEQEITGAVAVRNTVMSVRFAATTMSAPPLAPRAPQQWPEREGAIHFYDSAAGRWDKSASGGAPTGAEQSAAPIESFALVTWNVDFMESHIDRRLDAALTYLERVVLPKNDHPTIVLIQEFDWEAFPLLLSRPFIQDSYALTDISSESWIHTESGYGTVTLVPLTMLTNVRRVHRIGMPNTTMYRDALYVDLVVAPGRTLRIANVHLESLRGRSDAARIKQLEAVKAFIDSDGVHAAVVAGDMNPIGPDDAGLPARFNFRDAWIECRGSPVRSTSLEGKGNTDIDTSVQEDPESHTWGYQPTTRFPPRRMDKILLAGAAKATSIEVIGKGLTIDVPFEESSETEEEFELDQEDLTKWVSDHSAVLATISIQ